MKTPPIIVAILFLLISPESFSQTNLPYVADLAWSPDGQYIVLANTAGSLRIIAIQTGTEIVIEQAHNGPIYALAWNPNGSLIASGAGSPDNAVKIWNLTDDKATSEYRDFGVDVLSVSWSNDGKNVLTNGAIDFKGKIQQN